MQSVRATTVLRAHAHLVESGQYSGTAWKLLRESTLRFLRSCDHKISKPQQLKSQVRIPKNLTPRILLITVYWMVNLLVFGFEVSENLITSKNQQKSRKLSVNLLMSLGTERPRGS